MVLYSSVVKSSFQNISWLLQLTSHSSMDCPPPQPPPLYFCLIAATSYAETSSDCRLKNHHGKDRIWLLHRYTVRGLLVFLWFRCYVSFVVFCYFLFVLSLYLIMFEKNWVCVLIRRLTTNIINFSILATSQIIF